MKMITLYVPELYLKKLDELIDMGHFPNRSEAIRVSIRDLIRNEGIISEKKD